MFKSLFYGASVEQVYSAERQALKSVISSIKERLEELIQEKLQKEMSLPVIDARIAALKNEIRSIDEGVVKSAQAQKSLEDQFKEKDEELKLKRQEREATKQKLEECKALLDKMLDQEAKLKGEIEASMVSVNNAIKKYSFEEAKGFRNNVVVDIGKWDKFYSDIVDQQIDFALIGKTLDAEVMCIKQIKFEMGEIKKDIAALGIKILQDQKKKEEIKVDLEEQQKICNSVNADIQKISEEILYIQEMVRKHLGKLSVDVVLEEWTVSTAPVIEGQELKKLLDKLGAHCNRLASFFNEYHLKVSEVIKIEVKAQALLERRDEILTQYNGSMEGKRSLGARLQQIEQEVEKNTKACSSTRATIDKNEMILRGLFKEKEGLNKKIQDHDKKLFSGLGGVEVQKLSREALNEIDEKISKNHKDSLDLNNELQKLSVEIDKLKIEEKNSKMHIAGSEQNIRKFSGSIVNANKEIEENRKLQSDTEGQIQKMYEEVARVREEILPYLVQLPKVDIEWPDIQTPNKIRQTIEAKLQCDVTEHTPPIEGYNYREAEGTGIVVDQDGKINRVEDNAIAEPAAAATKDDKTEAQPNSDSSDDASDGNGGADVLASLSGSQETIVLLDIADEEDIYGKVLECNPELREWVSGYDMAIDDVVEIEISSVKTTDDISVLDEKSGTGAYLYIPEQENDGNVTFSLDKNAGVFPNSVFLSGIEMSSFYANS